jgi:hypothetical protein
VDFLLDKMTSRDFTVSALVSARQELGHFRIAIRKECMNPMCGMIDIPEFA